MNEEYEKELAYLKYKMEKAEKFAKKLPIFSDQILRNKNTEDEQSIHFGDRYKGLYLGWGIRRSLFETGTNRTVTNYPGDSYKEYLFHIYINTLSQYNSHEHFGLDDICESIPLFFYDKLNSTFYATDEQIETLLDSLLEWRKQADKKLVEHNRQEKIKQLKSDLEKLTNEDNS